MSTECGLRSLDSSEDFDYVYKTASEIAKVTGSGDEGGETRLSPRPNLLGLLPL
jgi:hypothetical protein